LNTIPKLLRATWCALALGLAATVSSGQAQDTSSPDYHPVLRISPAAGPIAIDGDLSDAGWRNAARAGGFVEVDPGDQIKPAVESAVLMTYDQSHLFIALIAYDDPRAVRVSLCDRDNIFRDDYFGILLDTYGDMAWGYEIFVNPIGIQGDLRLLSSGMEDGALDLVFESRGVVTDSGYQVELAIPFASLRFPDRPEQTWRLNLWRDRQRENRYQYSWVAQDRDNSCFICQYGTLEGIRDIKPGSNLDILPNIIAYQSGELIDPNAPGSDFHNADPDAELALNVRYGVSSNSSLELAVNPDFSQVESDAGQVDVNTTFALWYPESRPFFQEGSDLFSTWINAIHTRMINDPVLAAKFTGQFGRWSAAYLLARDEHSPLIVPLQQQSAGAALENSTSNIVRLRRTFRSDSYVGLTLTDRRLDGFTSGGSDYGAGSGTLYGLDSRLRLNDNYQFELQVLGSYTRELGAADLIDTTQKSGTAQQYFGDGHTVALDGESFGGQAVYAEIERESRSWFAGLEYFEKSSGFRTDNGFETSNDRRQFVLNAGLEFRPNREWLVDWSPSFMLARVFEHDATIDLNPAHFDPGTIDEWFLPELEFTFKGPTEVGVSYLTSRERFSGVLFNNISRGNIWIDAHLTEMVQPGFSVDFGRSIYRQRSRQYEEVIPEAERTTPEDSVRIVAKRPVMGEVLEVDAWLDLKPTQRLRITPELTYSHLDHQDSYLEAHPGTEREIFSGYILRTRLTYQFTREWFLRLIVEYNDFADELAVEPLVTYKVNPYTVFYVGMGSNYRNFDPDDYSQLDGSEWHLARRQFFAKFQYLFRI